jgi:CHASE3 domain sensor protein
MILESKAIDTQEEKQERISLLVVMEEEHIQRLYDILTREKKKLKEIQDKYNKKKKKAINKIIKDNNLTSIMAV